MGDREEVGDRGSDDRSAQSEVKEKRWDTEEAERREMLKMMREKDGRIKIRQKPMNKYRAWKRVRGV